MTPASSSHRATGKARRREKSAGGGGGGGGRAAAVAAAAASDGAACKFTHVIGFGALASKTAVGATVGLEGEAAAGAVSSVWYRCSCGTHAQSSAARGEESSSARHSVQRFAPPEANARLRSSASHPSLTACQRGALAIARTRARHGAAAALSARSDGTVHWRSTLATASSTSSHGWEELLLAAAAVAARSSASASASSVQVCTSRRASLTTRPSACLHRTFLTNLASLDATRLDRLVLEACSCRRCSQSAPPLVAAASSRSR